MRVAEIVAPEQVIEKQCTGCKEVKPLEDFSPLKTGKYGRKARCKKCCYAYEKEWRKTLSPERLRKSSGYKGRNTHHYNARKDHVRNKYLKRTYNIDSKIYNEMFQAQGGVCAICGTSEAGTNQFGELSLSVDHDHVTGKVRGLLCAPCNWKLALIEDTNFVLAAQSYLERYRL